MAETRPPLVLVPAMEERGDLDVARRALGDAGRLEVLAADGKARRRQLESARAVLVFAWRIEHDEIPLLRNVSLVQSVWAGVDRLPVESLAVHHPQLMITSGSGPNAPQVAEFAVALYLDCAKRITLRDRDMRHGGWPQGLSGRRIAGSRIGVVGLGAIGLQVTRILLGLNAHVTGVTRTGDVPAELAGRVTGVSTNRLRSVLADLDGLILCLPLTRATQGLVDREVLQEMKKDATLVNIARGKIVDQEALFSHLQDHPDFMAGLDVWWRYPKDGKVRPQDHPFERLENVVMTPHSAFNVPGSRAEMIANAAKNVARHLRGERPHNVVDAGPAEK